MISPAESGSQGRGAVIGLDGSEGSRHALNWLLTQKAFGLKPIVPVMAYDLPVTANRLSPLGMLEDENAFADNAELQLRAEIDASGLAGRHRPSASESASGEIDAVLSQGRPGAVLVEEGSKRELLVVGCRGRSTVAEIVLGSVGSHCVMHADVPVAIVPKRADADKPIDRVVVGIDGSENSQAALQWAVDHSHSTCSILAVSVYSMAPFAALGVNASDSQLASHSQRLVDTAIGSLTPTENMARIVGVVMEGDPRNTLRAEGDKADLIVLGARGHKGVTHLLLGSVATSLTHHPTAATVVVPA